MMRQVTVIKLNHYFYVKLAYYFKAFTIHQKKSPSVTVPFDLVKTKIKYQLAFCLLASIILKKFVKVKNKHDSKKFLDASE